MNQKQYTEFVAFRFKKMGGTIESLLHAAVGMAGEAIEALDAKDFSHRVEEFGDVEFYHTAAGIAVPALYLTAPPVADKRTYSPEDLVFATGDFLDATKKLWVYNKEFALTSFLVPWNRIREVLDGLYAARSITRELVLTANVGKLFIRYPVGYSDNAAHARADKEAT